MCYSEVMKKNKKKITLKVDHDQHQTMRRLQWEDKTNAMREGRRQRASVFGNTKKEASKKACRKGNW